MPLAWPLGLNGQNCISARGDTMSYIYTNAHSQYGASMGRRDNVAEALDVKKLHLERVRLDSGGYDPGGAYWGLGAPLYVAWGDGQEMFFRARDRREANEIAKGVFKHAEFYR